MPTMIAPTVYFEGTRSFRKPRYVFWFIGAWIPPTLTGIAVYEDPSVLGTFRTPYAAPFALLGAMLLAMLAIATLNLGRFLTFRNFTTRIDNVGITYRGRLFLWSDIRSVSLLGATLAFQNRGSLWKRALWVDDPPSINQTIQLLSRLKQDLASAYPHVLIGLPHR